MQSRLKRLVSSRSMQIRLSTLIRVHVLPVTCRRSLSPCVQGLLTEPALRKGIFKTTLGSDSLAWSEP